MHSSSSDYRDKGSLWSILSDSGLLIAVSVSVQIVAFLLLPWISRLYAPDALGQFGLILTVSSILSIVAGGRYEQAIVVSQESRERYTLLRLTIVLICLSGVAMQLLVAVAGYWIKGGQVAASWQCLYTVPLLVFALGVLNTLSHYAISSGRFGRLAASRTIQGLGNNGLKVGLGLLTPTIWGLYLAQMASTLLALAPLLRRQTTDSFARDTSKSSLVKVAKKYRSFPRYSLPQTLVNNLLPSLLVMMLPLGFSAIEVGLVTMATMLVKRPVQLVADNLSQVYFNRLSTARHERLSWHPLVRPLLLIGLVGGIPVLIGLWWVIPYLVEKLLAPEYARCSEVIQMMLLPLIPNTLASIINVIPDILGRQRHHLYVQVAMLVIEFVSLVLLLSHYTADFYTVLLYFHIILLVVYSCYLVWLIHLTREQSQLN